MHWTKSRNILVIDFASTPSTLRNNRSHAYLKWSPSPTYKSEVYVFLLSLSGGPNTGVFHTLSYVHCDTCRYHTKRMCQQTMWCFFARSQHMTCTASQNECVWPTFLDLPLHCRQFFISSVLQCDVINGSKHERHVSESRLPIQFMFFWMDASAIIMYKSHILYDIHSHMKFSTASPGSRSHDIWVEVTRCLRNTRQSIRNYTFWLIIFQQHEIRNYTRKKYGTNTFQWWLCLKQRDGNTRPHKNNTVVNNVMNLTPLETHPGLSHACLLWLWDTALLFLWNHALHNLNRLRSNPKKSSNIPNTMLVDVIHTLARKVVRIHANVHHIRCIRFARDYRRARCSRKIGAAIKDWAEERRYVRVVPSVFEVSMPALLLEFWRSVADRSLWTPLSCSLRILTAIS